MKKIAVWGWWQGKNLGDNWIKKTIKEMLPYAEFVDTTTYDFCEYDFVICGGGGLFIYDVIKPWRDISSNVSFGMLGIGAEFIHKSNVAKELYKKALFFYARDQYSLDCMKIEKNERSYDITFWKPLQWKYEINDSTLYLIWRDGKELLKDPRFEKYIEYEDVKLKWESIIEKNFTNIIRDDFQTVKDDIEDRIKNCDFVISGRYHGIVAAIQSGIPFIAIDICPKIRALLTECGLEKFCVKISEIDKIEELIIEAKEQIEIIRKKEWDFRNKANNVLIEQVEKIKKQIFNEIKPLRIIHYGSYWMKENDVVNVMSDDLSELCELKKIDLKIYDDDIDQRIKVKIETPNGCLCVLDRDKIEEDINRFHPDCIILNSGGLVLEDMSFQMLKKKGIISVGISLSDPDVFPYNGSIYSYKFDLFYTNSKYSYLKQYDSKMVNIKLLPFAASLKHHYYMSEVEKKYDIVVVGNARSDRQEIIDCLSEKYEIGVYGNGWKETLGIVNGKDHVRAINSGKMYLSFSKTVAGYQNIKVGLFEAIACKQVVITEYMEEIKDYFEIGKEILCYRNLEELKEIIDYYLKNNIERELIREKSYNRFLKEHTYINRFKTVVEDILSMQCVK